MTPPRIHFGNVNICFRWSGATVYSYERRTVCDIEIQGLPIQVKIYNLPHLKKDESQPLNFTVKETGSDFSSNRESLSISIDQLNRIRIIAGNLPPIYSRPALEKDSETGRYIPWDTSHLRTETQLDCKKPSNIEVGAYYNIVCTHAGAKLVKCEPLGPKDEFGTFLGRMFELQNSINPNLFGWGDYLISQLYRIGNQTYLTNSREQIEKMLNQSKHYILSDGEEKIYPGAVDMLEKLILVYEEQETIFRNIEVAIAEGRYGDAWGLIPKLNKEEKKAEAFNILIKGYIDGSNNFSQELLNQMLAQIPEGTQKEDVINYINAVGVKRTKFYDPEWTFLVTSKMPQGELKAQLIEEVKAAQATFPEVDPDTTLLFGNEEVEQELPPVTPEVEPPAALLCIIS